MIFNQIKHTFYTREVNLISTLICSDVSGFLLAGFHREVAVTCHQWCYHDGQREKSSVVVFRVRCLSSLAYSYTVKNGAFRVPLSTADDLSSMWIPADGCLDKHWGDLSWELYPAAWTWGLSFNLKAHLENQLLAVTRNLVSFLTLPRQHVSGIIAVQLTRFGHTALYL